MISYQSIGNNNTNLSRERQRKIYLRGNENKINNGKWLGHLCKGERNKGHAEKIKRNMSLRNLCH